MPYTRAELETYQWYQDRIEARRDEYITYLNESKDEQEENEIRQHIVDKNNTLLSFEDIDDEVRLKEPFKRAGLDSPDQNIIHKNMYPVFSSGEKFNLTIDTSINELIDTRDSLPVVRLVNQPQENLLEPKLFNQQDTNGTIVSLSLLTPSRKFPRERTDGYTIDLINGDIVAPKGWNNISVSTDEERIKNYLQIYYIENNSKRQFPTQQIFNSYIGTLLSSFIEYEILVIEKEDLDLIPLGTPMVYNAG